VKPVGLLVLCLLAPSAVAREIDAYKYLVVEDFTSDPYGIARELRAQGQARGFTVVSSVTEVPAVEVLKICRMTGSWSREGYGGQIAMRVVDAASGALIAEATTQGISWWSPGRTVRKLVEKIYAQIGYSGFNEEAYRQRIQRTYPTRPKVGISEAQIRESEPRNPVEGVWSDPHDKYRLGIVPAPKGSGTDADFVAVVLRSNSPLWEPGEIKAEIRSTASADIFTCTYFLENKSAVGTTLTLDAKSVLKGSLRTAEHSDDLFLMRVWPKVADSSVAPAVGKATVTGTGFLLARTGLIATNWHVVADRGNIEVMFPDWKQPARAGVVIKDAVNDLAVLRLADPTRLGDTCSVFPYQLTSSSQVALGERVSTIGYPLQSLLGSAPKFAEGSVASKTGLQDDPRMLQISAQVQPGSSGSPLFDSKGHVIGIVVATLDAGYLYRTERALPQNVNWAVKSDYLLNLLNMIPNEMPASPTMTFSPETAARCVATISAW
jgi:serine protease Do